MTTIWTFANGTEMEFQGKKEEFFSIDNPRFPMERIDEMTTIYDIDELQRENDKLRKIIESLLDGLDANNDFDAGLTDEQWEQRIKAAREAIK